MPKTDYYYFDGTAEFTMLHKTDNYGNWSIKIKMDEPSLEKYIASGIQGAVIEDSVFFRRPKSKIIKKELVEYDPPAVVEADGETPVTDLIGKGSKVCVKVSAYDTLKGRGHTLLAVQVYDLVKVEGTGEYRNF